MTTMTRVLIQIDFECPGCDAFWQGARALLGSRLATAEVEPFEVTEAEWAALQALPGWSSEDYPAYAPHPFSLA